jgi:DNA invertase Pin-like site-specific DNA recombinase
VTDLITYIRVSTSQQGRSGLGIEAQRQGSDALDRRPQLKAALAAARKLRCHVGVAHVNRDNLSREELPAR